MKKNNSELHDFTKDTGEPKNGLFSRFHIRNEFSHIQVIYLLEKLLEIRLHIIKFIGRISNGLGINISFRLQFIFIFLELRCRSVWPSG